MSPEMNERNMLMLGTGPPLSCMAMQTVHSSSAESNCGNNLVTMSNMNALHHQQLLAATQNISSFVPQPDQPVAEFLYQLTKMLTCEDKAIIEWAYARIMVHNPPRLASEILHKYFRHSKYASFQRQLNYFGFRKIAGKGKMSPCSYMNDDATDDIRSLLFIKRKSTGSSAKNKNTKNIDKEKTHDSKSKLKRKIDEDESSRSEESGKRQRQLDDILNTSDTRISPPSVFSPVDNASVVSISNSNPSGDNFVDTNTDLTNLHQLEVGRGFGECFHFPSESTLAALTTLSKKYHDNHMNASVSDSQQVVEKESQQVKLIGNGSHVGVGPVSLPSQFSPDICRSFNGSFNNTDASSSNFTADIHSSGYFLSNPSKANISTDNSSASYTLNNEVNENNKMNALNVQTSSFINRELSNSSLSAFLNREAAAIQVDDENICSYQVGGVEPTPLHEFTIT